MAAAFEKDTLQDCRLDIFVISMKTRDEKNLKNPINSQHRNTRKTQISPENPKHWYFYHFHAQTFLKSTFEDMEF